MQGDPIFFKPPSRQTSNGVLISNGKHGYSNSDEDAVYPADIEHQPIVAQNYTLDTLTETSFGTRSSPSVRSGRNSDDDRRVVMQSITVQGVSRTRTASRSSLSKSQALFLSETDMNGHGSATVEVHDVHISEHKPLSISSPSSSHSLMAYPGAVDDDVLVGSAPAAQV